MLDSDQIVTYTEVASTKLQEIMKEQGNEGSYLRVSITEGPGGGFEYVFGLVENRIIDVPKGTPLVNLIEASKDLGLNRIKTFFKVILPLSVPGIVAGSLLVFIPVVGEFIIPEMLGGSDRLYYGKILWEEFFVNRNWPGASALAFSGIIILVLPIVIFQILYSRWSQKNEI